MTEPRSPAAMRAAANENTMRMTTGRCGMVAAIAAILAVACGGDSATVPAGGEPGGDAGADVGGTEVGGADAGDDTGATDGAEQEVCYYPSPVGFARGLAFPDFSWNAVRADGTAVVFDLYDFYCNDEAWGQYDSLAFLIITDWCPNCPAYMEWVDALAAQMEEEGMLLFFLDVQNNSGGTAYTEGSNRHINQYTPNGSGLRAGDGDNQFRTDGVLMSGLVEYFPTSFVVRRSDMALIADQRDTSYYLPLVEIAMDPDADWSDPPAPEIVPAFPANCDESQEEPYEPNNQVDEAGVISEASTVEGGVCDSQPDFYQIDIEGAWRAELEFSHALGDLDMYVWDLEAQGPLQGDDGRPIGSDSTTDDESFEYEGRQTLFIYGFRGATAPYTLTITPL